MAQRWKVHLQYLHSLLHAGGYLELVETTGELISVGRYGAQANRWTQQGMQLLGLETHLRNNAIEWLQEIGYEKIQVLQKEAPLGGWSNEYPKAAELGIREWQDGLREMKILVDDTRDISSHDWAEWQEKWLEEVDERRTKWVLIVITARKAG